MDNITKIRYWCYKILPLVYDDSLSYYEVLNKLTDKVNEIIDRCNSIDESIKVLFEFKKSIEDMINTGNLPKAFTDALVKWTDTHLESIISKAIKHVYFGLNDAGYFVAYIPDSYADIVFNTTGYDYTDKMQPEYGHLVLSMEI